MRLRPLPPEGVGVCTACRLALARDTIYRIASRCGSMIVGECGAEARTTIDTASARGSPSAGIAVLSKRKKGGECGHRDPEREAAGVICS